MNTKRGCTCNRHNVCAWSLGSWFLVCLSPLLSLFLFGLFLHCSWSLDSCCLVLWFLVSWFLVSGSWLLVCGSWFLIPWFLVLSPVFSRLYFPGACGAWFLILLPVFLVRWFLVLFPGLPGSLLPGSWFRGSWLLGLLIAGFFVPCSLIPGALVPASLPGVPVSCFLGSWYPFRCSRIP